MTHAQGSGAGQAIEDAYIMGSLLGHPAVTSDKIPIALEIYEQVRLPFAIEVQRRSAQAAWIGSFQDPLTAQFDAPGGEATVECTGEDVGQLWNVGHQVADNWKWTWTTNAEDDRVRAMKILFEKLGI